MKDIDELAELLQDWVDKLYEQCVRGEWDIKREKNNISHTKLLTLIHKKSGEEIVVEMGFIKTISYWKPPSLTINGTTPNTIYNGGKFEHIWKLSEMQDDYELYMGVVSEDGGNENGNENDQENLNEPFIDDDSILF